MEQPTSYQKRIRRAMEGNIAAYFHPFDEAVAFLYPNGQINVYDSRTFASTDELTVNKWDAETGERVGNQELIRRTDVKMSRQGFDRKGRVDGASF